jgi:hypothetical protein
MIDVSASSPAVRQLPNTWGGNYDLIDRVKRNYASAEISGRLKSLLAIAGKVQKGGKHVTPEISRGHASRAPPTKRFTTGF